MAARPFHGERGVKPRSNHCADMGRNPSQLRVQSPAPLQKDGQQRRASSVL